jgi:RimJ/RimL family protein N-acetyltransferase
MKSGRVTVRAWTRDDFRRLVAAAPRLSSDTLCLRFWTATPVLPSSYLRSIEQRWPLAWDAVVAVDGDELVGWAEFGRNTGRPDTADVGVCVVDAEQGHGLGTALLTALVARARDAGLASVHADIAPANGAARHAWRTATGGRATTYGLAA